MDDKKKQTLLALSKSFVRLNSASNALPGESWSADFVPGKGSGLTFLLHGKPGVGKTLTAGQCCVTTISTLLNADLDAECIAAFARRPLMVLTASDIGTTPEEVDKNLSEHFRRAERWEAIMLIDEADVFMERRSTNDLVRNSLVSSLFPALIYP
jgi:SpoVK/Ycf46/Vps4 family AAA+-type ATPase